MAKAEPGTSPPDWQQVEHYLLRHRSRLRADSSIPPARRDQIEAHYERAIEAGQVPSPQTWTAWQAFGSLHERLDAVAFTRSGAAPEQVPSPQPEPFSDTQIVALARLLHRHRVNAVIIGGVGAVLYKVPIERTNDGDFCPATDPENIDRVVAALTEVHAVLRDTTTGRPNDDVPVHRNLFGPSAQTVVFLTDIGPIDVCLRPDGTDGYASLSRNQRVVEFHGQLVPVAGLQDIIDSKRAANRAKDRKALPAYEATAERLRRAGELD